jgi:hypothetical protein
MANEVEIIVEPVEPSGLPVERLREWLAGDRNLQEVLGDVDIESLLLSEPEILQRERKDNSPFIATVFDPQQNRAVEVSGFVDQPDSLRIKPSSYRPLPTPDELSNALDILRADSRYASRVGPDDAVVYQPMPPLADLEQDDGTLVRRPTLGIFSPTGTPRHQIVAADLGARDIDWQPAGLDHPTDSDCEAHLPVGVESIADTGGLDSVHVRVIRNGTTLWSLEVVRPRNSSPTTFGKGSGVELRHVRYRGRLGLWRAHVPILNVLYDDGVTYRDWQNQETPFLAVGTDPVGPGWRLCTQPPATILEAGTDAGNFQGVALWYDDGELRLVSEVQAGWYRYISDWRLRDDGTIRPRFGFAGTRNPRTCMRHQHHVYWRLDFDIDGAGRDVIQQQGLFFPGSPQWSPIVRETQRKRSIFARRWRVVDRDTHRGYRITPGLGDGTADAYGVADIWCLRYHGDELDDGVSVVGGSPADTQIQLSKYINGEAIDGTDVVLWYAGHFTHDENQPSPHQGHIVGPELRPVNW